MYGKAEGTSSEGKNDDDFQAMRYMTNTCALNDLDYFTAMSE